MLLVFDIGNSNIVLGVYKDDILLKHWRISTDRQKTGDEYGMLLNNLFNFNGLKISDIEAIIISSVVPPLVVPLSKMCQRYFNIDPLVVGPGIKTGIKIKYENPREVGADRIVNAVAAREKFPGSLIIVDFGTATTFCAINNEGDYLGGAIAPGIGISSEALFQRAAKLYDKGEFSTTLSLLIDLRNNFEEGRFSRTISSNNPEEIPFFHFKGNIF